MALKIFNRVRRGEQIGGVGVRCLGKRRRGNEGDMSRGVRCCGQSGWQSSGQAGEGRSAQWGEMKACAFLICSGRGTRRSITCDMSATTVVVNECGAALYEM